MSGDNQRTQKKSRPREGPPHLRKSEFNTSRGPQQEEGPMADHDDELDPSEDLTTGEAAEELGVPLSTIKVWLDRLPIPTRTDRRNHRRLDKKAMALLQVVKADRARGLGYDTIRRKLGPEVGQAVTEPVHEASEPQPSPVDTLALAQMIEEVITRQGGMAERMAAYAHRAGQLEAENKALESDKERLGRELAERTADYVTQAQELERLRLDNERLRAEKEATERESGQKSRRRWWPWP